MQKRLTAHCSRNSLRNHSKSMLSEGTNGELHRVQEDVVLSAAGGLVLIGDVESDVVDCEVVEEVEDELVVLLVELIEVVAVVVVGGNVVVVIVAVVVVAVKVVEVDSAVVLVVLCALLV